MSDINNPPPPPGGAPPPPPPSGAMAGVDGREQANFGQRLGALIIDALIIGVPVLIIYAVLLSVVPTELVVCQDGTAICEEPTGAGFGILLIAYLAIVIVALWYYGEFDGNRGATIGRKTLGIKLVKVDTDETVGFWRAVGRQFARIPSSFICYLGYFWMIWDSDSQTWHDKIVKTQVIKA